MNVQVLASTPDRSIPDLDQAIEFVNTTGLSGSRPFEALPTIEAALGWLAAAGYLRPEEVAAELARLAGDEAAGRRALAGVRAVRAGLRELFDAAAEERVPSDGALAAINDVLELPESVRLVRAGSGIQITHRREGRPLDQALASIARSIADEAVAGRPERFRICENDRCRWAFYDKSRPGTRRWCEMSSCGNRMKAARHRARHRADASAETGAPSA
jgi:predicted RNA-binding Zn ribbon-like protein